MKMLFLKAVFTLLLIAVTSCSPSHQQTPAHPQPGPVPTPSAMPVQAPAVPVESSASDSPGQDDDFEFETADETPAPQSLSEFNFFRDMAGQVPRDDVVPYGLNTEHFADYARVRRFVRVPAGAHVQYDEDAALDFPVGTVFLQTFSYPLDRRDPASKEQYVETRMLRRLTGGWDGVSYIWNKEGSDARRALAGGIVAVSWTGDDGAPHSLKYVVPNKNDCKRCHENQGVMLIIGPTVANLNRDYPYAEGSENQIRHWSARGILQGAPDNADDAPRLARWDDPNDGPVDVRARAWLDVNCAHCHNPLGAGGVSGLDLRLAQDSPIRLGVYKPPVAAGRGSEGQQFSIEPGKPQSSFLIGRLISTDPSVMMPPVGRRLPNSEAIALVGEWIAGMRFDESEAQQLREKQLELLEQIKREGKWPETVPE